MENYDSIREYCEKIAKIFAGRWGLLGEVDDLISVGLECYTDIVKKRNADFSEKKFENYWKIRVKGEIIDNLRRILRRNKDELVMFDYSDLENKSKDDMEEDSFDELYDSIEKMDPESKLLILEYIELSDTVNAKQIADSLGLKLTTFYKRLRKIKGIIKDACL